MHLSGNLTYNVVGSSDERILQMKLLYSDFYLQIYKD